MEQHTESLIKMIYSSRFNRTSFAGKITSEASKIVEGVVVPSAKGLYRKWDEGNTFATAVFTHQPPLGFLGFVESVIAIPKTTV